MPLTFTEDDFAEPQAAAPLKFDESDFDDPNEPHGLHKVTTTIGDAFTRSGELISGLVKAGTLLSTGNLDLAKQEIKSTAEANLPPETKKALEDVNLLDTSPWEEARQSLPLIPRAAAGVGASTIASAPQLAATAVLPVVGAASFGFNKEGFDPVQAATAMIAPYAGKFAGKVAAKVAEKAGITSDKALELIDRAGGAGGVATIISAPSVYQISQMTPGAERDTAIEDAAANAVLMGILGGAHKVDERAPITVLKEKRLDAAAKELAKNVDAGEFLDSEPAARTETVPRQTPPEGVYQTPRGFRPPEQSPETVAPVSETVAPESGTKSAPDETKPTQAEADLPESVKQMQSVLAMDGDQFYKFTRAETGGLTNAAYRLGLSIKTPEELQALKDHQQAASTAFKQKLESGDMNAAMQLATKPQFFREAYEAATGTGSGGEEMLRRNPDFKAPFPIISEEAPKVEKPATEIKPDEEQTHESGAKFTLRNTKSGNTVKNWTQTANGKRVGDTYDEGDAAKVVSVNGQNTVTQPSEYRVKTYGEILDGSKNEVEISVRDMTDEEIKAKQEKLKKDNQLKKEMGLPEDPIPEPAKAKPPVTPPKTPEGLDPEISDLILSPASGIAKAALMKNMADRRGVTTKAMQETVEAELVRHADRIAKQPDITPQQKFDHLTELYRNQPRFSGRTSTSMQDQAYSTPVPLAYALNHAVGSEGQDIYEPTAGNGALMIGGEHGKSAANEKNPERIAELKKNGVKTVTGEDATKFRPKGQFSRVHTNPPFGPSDNQNIGGYGIKRLEHLISAKALDAMKDDGAGYMILGAGLHSSKTGRGAQRVFENYLYSHYNVVGNFEVNGDLYANQGAKFPVRILVVNGRRAEPLKPGEYSPEQVTRFNTWGEVWNESERIRNEIESQRKAVDAGGTPRVPVRPPTEREPAEVSGSAARPPSGIAPTPDRGGKPGGKGVSRPPVGEQPAVREPAKPAAGQVPKPAAGERPDNATGGDKQPVGGVESGDGGGGAAPASTGERGAGGGKGAESGIVSKPVSLIDKQLAELDDIDALIEDASAANTKNVESRSKRKLVGQNTEGQDVYEDENGVRSYVEGNVRVTEPVRIIPTREGVVTAKSETRRPEFEVAPKKGATDIIREAAKHGVAGVDEAMTGLNKLFGSKTRLGALTPGFDEKTYAEAKPHFDEAWKQFQKAGKSLKEYAQFLLNSYSDAIKPYLKHYLEEKKTAPAPEPDVKEPPLVKGTEYQVAYEPRSTAPAFGTLIPKSIAPGVHAYLDDLKTRVGPLDDFLAKELELPVEQLKRVLSGEQVDGAAMAIDQMKHDGATIIGDQTGIGKGRQAAAVLWYAMKNGAIPVFFTKDPKLFSDMYGDMGDLLEQTPQQLSTTLKPFILGDSTKAHIVDTEGNVIHRSPSKKLQDESIANILQNGLTETGYNAIFATYSQINTRNARQLFLERLTDSNPVVLVMDEAHDAAGDAETSMQAAFFQGGRVKRGSGSNIEFVNVPGLLNASGTKTERGGGVAYLSATYAKRPENMPVYFRTALKKAADSFGQIVDAMKRGGVALQQAVSEALAKAGQYTRREREFTGVSYKMLPVQVADEAELVDHIDQVTDVLQQLVEFSKGVRESQEGSTAMTEGQIAMTDFASIVHNQIGQLLLAAKADAVVEEAIAAHKRGEKPVIALMNTMESFLDHYAQDRGMKAGDTLQIRWNELLAHALARTLRISEELPNGDTIVRQMDPANLGPVLESQYHQIEEIAKGIESKFPVSPIDYIIQKLNKAGVKMVELTGRQSGINYTDFEQGIGTYTRFPSAKKNKVVNGFNSGAYDGMLLNASGSTGLSAHASEKFKDQKPRHMLIAQPAADINTFVQTLGRIFRTGLVMKGKDEAGQPYGAKYSHLVLPLQAELRPAAMAARKMKSLNANTTAEADNAIKIESEDFLNKYGDAVVADYLDQRQDLQDMLDLQVEHKQDGSPEVKKDLARTFTGRMARMPDAWQKEAYEYIIPAYRELIQQLKNTGEYDLEIVTHDDWDGIRSTDEELSPGTDESNIFTASVRLQQWNVQDNRHVPSGAEMSRELAKNHGTPEKLQAEFDNFSTQANARLDQRSTDLQQKLAEAKTDIEKVKAENAIRTHDEAVQRWRDRTMSLVGEITRTAGKVVNLSDKETGESFDAMLVKFTPPNSNRLAPSAFRFTFMIDAPGGIAHLTGSMFNPEKWSIEPSDAKPEDLAGGRKGARYDRYFVVGNPIRGYTATGGRGKMVRFQSHDGSTITGLLMPKNWGPENLASDPRLDLTSGAAVKHYLTNHVNRYNPHSVTSGGIVSITPSRSGSGYLVKTGAARRTGGSIFLDPKLVRLTGDFTKVGNRMEVTIEENKLEKVADAIRDITKSPFRPEVTGEAAQSNVSDSNNKTRSKKNLGPSMGAMTPSAEEEQPGWTGATGIKNATVERERALRGLPPAMQQARRGFGRVWDEAMAAVDQNPAIQDELVAELSANPRAVTDFEDALLLHRQIELQNDYGKLTRDLAYAYEDGKDFPNRLADAAELRGRVAAAADQLYEIYEVNKRVGTETGRGLNARKMMAREDYSLAAMETGKRAANGGKPLTDDQIEEVRQLHEDIDKLQKEHDEYVNRTNQRISELEAKKTLDDIFKTTVTLPPNVRKLSDRIIQVADKEASDALARIKARRKEGRTYASLTILPPEDLIDYARYGAAKIIKGIVGSDWAKQMVDELGEDIKKHLTQIWKAAEQRRTELNEQVAGKYTAPKIKAAQQAPKTVKERQEDLSNKIGDKLAGGTLDAIAPLVQRLARLFVEDGIADRDELIDAVHGVLLDIDPTITRRDAMDAISGYGNFKRLSKDEISKEVRDLKGQMQQVAKLEDMQAGQPPLKTGLERRTPSAEESRLIRLVNEAKRKFQIPVTDPETQLKSSLDELKRRMQTRADELEKKLADGDFSPRPVRQPLIYDVRAKELKTRLETAKQKYQRGLLQDRLKNRPWWEKAADTFVKWRRGFILSSPITLAKLTSAAVQRMAFTPAEEAIGAGFSKAFPGLASKAKREGGFNTQAEAKAITEAFTTGMKDAADAMMTGQTELDVLYGGGREGYVRESMILPRSVIDFFGQLHAALKAPTKRAEFTRSFEKRIAAAMRDGVDTSDPMVQTEAAVAAYKDANRSIFLQDNRVVTAYKMWLAGIEAKNKATGKPSVGGKVLGTVARTVLPIVRVPTNLVAETFTYAFGSLSGGAKLAHALSNGIDTLKPEEADMIMRHLKKGSLGAAMMLTGFLLPNFIGGYYVSGQKRDPKDVKIGSIKIGDWQVPSYLLHNPLLETLQLGATIRRVADSKLRGQKQGIPAGLMAGALGLAEEVPFVREMFGELPKLFNGNERSAFLGETLKGIAVPQALQWFASYQDKAKGGETMPRKPQTLWQHIETGLPWLRNDVPKKNVMQE